MLDRPPQRKNAKTQKHTYRYDANGNMTYEYMRGNGTGQAKNETLYTSATMMRSMGNITMLRIRIC